MSSLLSPEGVAKLRLMAVGHRKLENEIAELENRIKADSARLSVARDEFRTNRYNLIRAVEGMGCLTKENHGWEARFSWMLSELVK